MLLYTMVQIFGALLALSSKACRGRYKEINFELKHTHMHLAIPRQLLPWLIKSTKVLNSRLITLKTIHEHYDNAACHSHTIKIIKTGTSLQDYGILELCQKYSSTVHWCMQCNNPESSITV